MNNKIIFIVESQFTKRDYNRFGIELLKKLGHQIEIWDLTPFLKPNLYLNYTPPDLYYKNHKIINSKLEANNQLSSLKKTDIIVALIHANYKNIFIFNYLRDADINFGFSFVNTISFSDKPLSIIKRIRRVLKTPKTIFTKLYKSFKESKIEAPRASFVMLGGSSSLDLAKSKGVIYKDTKLIYTHTRDYDLFLENQNNNKLFYEDYILMLDEFGPYHPDSLYYGNEPDCTAETYYPDLNRFFNKIEDKLKMKVVIASHPRANYNKMKNPFDGRKIINGKTIQLVKNAKIVLAHASTAINFAILYSKPLIFLNSAKFSVSYQHSINITSKTLFEKTIDISKDIEFNFFNFFNFNKKAYRLYKESFIKTSDSDDLNQWEIFSNFIKSDKLFEIDL